MCLPCTGMDTCAAFELHAAVAQLQALNYTVVSAYNKKETIYLLKDVTGHFRPGQMSALVRRLAACWLPQGGGMQ